MSTAGLEHGIGQTAAQQVERLHQGHAGLEQRRQLLIELEEVALTDRPTPPERRRQAAQEPAGPERQDEQAPLLEIAAQMRLALGGMDGLDDLAPWRAELTAEFHRKRLSRKTLAARLRWPGL